MEMQRAPRLVVAAAPLMQQTHVQPAQRPGTPQLASQQLSPRGNRTPVNSFTCPLNLDSILSRSTTFKPVARFGIEHMNQIIAVFAAIALVVLPAIAAADCPKGYVPCGERNQLCCPGK